MLGLIPMNASNPSKRSSHHISRFLLRLRKESLDWKATRKSVTWAIGGMTTSRLARLDFLWNLIKAVKTKANTPPQLRDKFREPSFFQKRNLVPWNAFKTFPLAPSVQLGSKCRIWKLDGRIKIKRSADWGIWTHDLRHHSLYFTIRPT